jgi:hypothetical protein
MEWACQCRSERRRRCWLYLQPGLFAEHFTLHTQERTQSGNSHQIRERGAGAGNSGHLPLEIDYGPGNPEAFKTGKIPAERAAELPSAPDNAAKQVLVSTEWWSSPEGEAVQKRWAEFIQKP